jgi:hypothetical protein
VMEIQRTIGADIIWWMYTVSLWLPLRAAIDDTPLVRPMCESFRKLPVKYGLTSFPYCTGKLL